jgi:cytochrome c oxidase subunit II
VGRFWSILFLFVPILGVAVFVCAMNPDSAPLYGHWFPEDISDHGYIIDNLFSTIMYLTGFIFVATGLALFWFLWKYVRLFSRDHKIIGLQFLFSTLIWFF